MAIKLRLYAQVVMIIQKDFDNKKGELKYQYYNFQGKSARPRLWFDIDHEWLEENFVTREPNFYKKFIKKILDMKTNKLFAVPIGNAKNI